MSYENFLRAYKQSKTWLRPWSLSLEIHLDQFYVSLPFHPGMHTPGNLPFFFYLAFYFPLPGAQKEIISHSRTGTLKQL